MALVAKILKEINEKNMLNHPFYQDWMEGKLSVEQLQNYASQYMPFVEAFPRYVSATHSLCESQKGRQMLAENLLDEEGFRHSEPHPILWKRFAEGLGKSIDDNELIKEKAQKLTDTFMELSRSSYEEGLVALYTYEHQIPEISKLKIEGLDKNYKINDKKTTEFFSVHEQADIYHSKACEELINELPEDKAEKCIAAAKKASHVLWDFLSEVYIPTNASSSQAIH